VRTFSERLADLLDGAYAAHYVAETGPSMRWRPDHTHPHPDVQALWVARTAAALDSTTKETL
jgi:hypothetical protein